MSTPLNDAEQAQLAAIQAEPVVPDQVKRAETWIGSYPYSSTALRALASVLTEWGDCDGSALISHAAQLMAEHEARTI